MESPPLVFDKDTLKARLTPIEYKITQEKGTERPYTNKYYKFNAKGLYHCKICDVVLFNSSTKYNSGSGWPSFYDVVSQNLLHLTKDSSGIGGNLLLIVTKPDIIRTEVSCKKCGSHLGHVFKDGPAPTGLRYCINSTSLEFRESALENKDNTIEPLISHPAVLGGCGGISQQCSFYPNDTSKDEISKILEDKEDHH